MIEAVLSQAVWHGFGDADPPKGADDSCDGGDDHASAWLSSGSYCGDAAEKLRGTAGHSGDGCTK